MEERDQALIDSYLANELSIEEKSRVEQRISEDPAFRELLNAYRNAVEALKQGERDRLKAHFKMHEKILDRGSKQLSSRVTLRWVMAAAAILLLGFIGWKFLLEDHRGGATPSAERMNQMYAENFSPFLLDMSDPAVRSDTITPLDQFNIDYWTGHYQEAVLHFKNLDNELQLKHGLRFRYANSLLSIGKFDEAKAEFQGIAEHGPSLHATESFWYLGLIELHEGNADQAREYLKTYRNSMNPLLPRQADNLLRQLGK